MNTKEILTERLKEDSPELYERYKKDGLIPFRSVEIKSIPAFFTQMILYKLGMYSTERLGVDRYHLNSAIRILISNIGEAKIEEDYKKLGKDWKVIKKRYGKINKLIEESKLFYDAITNKKFDKKDTNVVQRMFKKHFMKTSSKIPLIEQEFYDMFIFLAKISDLQYKKIPTEAFKALDQLGARKLDLTKRPQQTFPSVDSGGVS